MDVNVIVKIKSSYSAWVNIFDNDDENRGKICDDSKTLCGRVDDKTALINFYDVDMEGMKSLMGSDFLIELSKKMNIKNNEMHSFKPLPS